MTKKGGFYIRRRVLATGEEQLLVGVPGFEPGASWSQTKRSDLTELHPVAAASPPVYSGQAGHAQASPWLKAQASQSQVVAGGSQRERVGSQRRWRCSKATAARQVGQRPRARSRS